MASARGGRDRHPCHRNAIFPPRDFPAEYRDTLAQDVWTRALILGGYATADGLADDMARPRAATRPGCQAPACGDKRTAKPTHSRDAFRLLHRLRPGSEWAAKTKYHF